MLSQWKRSGGHGAPGQGPSPTPLRVLIVDANRDAADSLALLLRLWGYDARATYSAADALQEVDGFAPAVVISEVVLPYQNGYDLCRRLRHLRPDLLLIALTGLGQDADRMHCREAGFDLHIVKPAVCLDLHLFLRHKAAGNSDPQISPPTAGREPHPDPCWLVAAS